MSAGDGSAALQFLSKSVIIGSKLDYYSNISCGSSDNHGGNEQTPEGGYLP